MRREYDIFERFFDGSSIWRACVSGRFEAQRQMQGLTEHSGNEFFAIDIKAGGLVPVSLARKDIREQMKNAMKQTA